MNQALNLGTIQEAVNVNLVPVHRQDRQIIGSKPRYKSLRMIFKQVSCHFVWQNEQNRIAGIAVQNLVPSERIISFVVFPSPSQTMDHLSPCSGALPNIALDC